jgi:hypothetical protein
MAVAVHAAPNRDRGGSPEVVVVTNKTASRIRIAPKDCGRAPLVAVTITN